MACDHDWNTTSALRLVVEEPTAWMAAIVPMPPKLLAVRYCRRCGALALLDGDVASLRDAEAEKASQAEGVTT